MTPLHISEHGARPHQVGGFSVHRAHSKYWNPEYDGPNPSGPVKVLVKDHKAVTPEGAKLLKLRACS